MEDPSAAITLLSVEEWLVPDDSKSIRSFAFHVPEGTEALGFKFGWSPKHSKKVDVNREAVRGAVEEWLEAQGASLGEDELPEDIRRYVAKLPNLFNVVIRDPDGGWRGRSDKGRGSRKPLVITPKAPPEGFVEGPMIPGVWRADVEVHAVVPPGASFGLKIWNESLPKARKEKAPEDLPELATPERPFPGWFRGELHSHSQHSDGGYPVSKLVRRAGELGLDFLALTDHNTLSGHPELDACDFPTLKGVEVTTFHGHHVVLGVDEMIPWHDHGERADINEVAAAFREKGALFTLSHPYSIGDPVCTGCRFDSVPFDRENVDLIEIWHRDWKGERSDNQSAYDLWNEMWRDGYQPTAIGVRDWHNKTHEALLPGHLPTTAVESGTTEQADILAALRRGACYVTTGPWITFEMVSADGGTVPLGSRGLAGVGGGAAKVKGVSAKINVVLPPKEEGWSNLVAQLYRCGELCAESPAEKGGLLRLESNSAEPGWYRVELRQNDDPVVISNHIVLT